MGFPRQEYWSGLPFPSPGDLPGPGIEPVSLKSPTLAGRFFTTSDTWEAQQTLFAGKSLLWPLPQKEISLIQRNENIVHIASRELKIVLAELQDRIAAGLWPSWDFYICIYFKFTFFIITTSICISILFYNGST